MLADLASGALALPGLPIALLPARAPGARSSRGQRRSSALRLCGEERSAREHRSAQGPRRWCAGARTRAACSRAYLDGGLGEFMCVGSPGPGGGEFTYLGRGAARSEPASGFAALVPASTPPAAAGVALVSIGGDAEVVAVGDALMCRLPSRGGSCVPPELPQAGVEAPRPRSASPWVSRDRRWRRGRRMGRNYIPDSAVSPESSVSHGRPGYCGQL